MPTEAPTSTMAAAEKRIQAATRYSAARGYATLAMQPLMPKPSMTLPMLEQSAYAKETGSWVFAEVGPKREDPRETRRNSMAQASRRRSSAKEMMSSQSLPSLQRRKSSQRLTPTKKRAKRKSAAAAPDETPAWEEPPSRLRNKFEAALAAAPAAAPAPDILFIDNSGLDDDDDDSLVNELEALAWRGMPDAVSESAANVAVRQKRAAKDARVLLTELSDYDRGRGSLPKGGEEAFHQKLAELRAAKFDVQALIMTALSPTRESHAAPGSPPPHTKSAGLQLSYASRGGPWRAPRRDDDG
jgi:hypothetical protein